MNIQKTILIFLIVFKPSDSNTFFFERFIASMYSMFEDKLKLFPQLIWIKIYIMVKVKQK